MKLSALFILSLSTFGQKTIQVANARDLSQILTQHIWAATLSSSVVKNSSSRASMGKTTSTSTNTSKSKSIRSNLIPPNNAYSLNMKQMQMAQRNHQRPFSSSKRKNVLDQLSDEVTDCFPALESSSSSSTSTSFNTLEDQEDYYDDDDDEPFSFYANIRENVIINHDDYNEDYHLNSIIECQSSHDDTLNQPFHQTVQSVLKRCYLACPGEAYYSSPPVSNHKNEETTMFASLRTMRKKVKSLSPLPSKESIKPRPSEMQPTIDVMEDEIVEPSPSILAGIVKPLIPTSVWEALTGREFYFPSVLSSLVKTGINAVLPQSDEYIDWKPADSNTKKIMDLDDDEIRKAINEDKEILVWMGKFKLDGYGSQLPIVKTTSILPLSPKDMAELLMDSDRVKSYNTMSLGRKDILVFQHGVDSQAGEVEGSSFSLDGEAKIVRNLTKPPMSKKLMEFVTLMYARRIKEEDNVGLGIMGGSISGNDDGYIVVTRAVGGRQWNRPSKPNPVETRGGGKSVNEDNDEAEFIRSEILLGVNLLRSVPGEPNKTEVTAVTHVNTPNLPKMLAGAVGVKGAINFVNDIRSLYE